MYSWVFIYMVLYPLMVLCPFTPKHSGLSLSDALHRMPSIFDKPKILIQYIRLFFGLSNITEVPEFSHDISQNRNIYNYIDHNKDDIIFKDGLIVDGHHRYMANRYVYIKN